jgi:hypothetical protein
VAVSSEDGLGLIEGFLAYDGVMQAIVYLALVVYLSKIDVVFDDVLDLRVSECAAFDYLPASRDMTLCFVAFLVQNDRDLKERLLF